MNCEPAPAVTSAQLLGGSTKWQLPRNSWELTWEAAAISNFPDASIRNTSKTLKETGQVKTGEETG